MTPELFTSLASQGYNRIPVTREVLADLDTPLSSYLKLADGKYSYLLESVHGGEKWGRYSIIGLPCQQVLKISGHHAALELNGEVIEEHDLDDPLTFVEQFQSRFKVPELEGLPRFNGGLVGYFGYDTVRYIEPKLAKSCPPDPLKTPDILLMVSDQLVVFDNLSGKLILIYHADPAVEDAYQLAQSVLDLLVHRLRNQAPNLGLDNLGVQKSPIEETDFISGFSEDKFKHAVDEIKEYVLSGDVMQTVISQRMSIPFESNPLDLYRALRCLNPSPYMYFLNLDDFHIVGSSPEILARVEHGEVTVRPIAGTRKRGLTEEDDLALEADLLADPKECAEHLMLIDLGRNDAGRVSEIGSVKLTDKMVIERYSHVMHIVSNVVGQIDETKYDAMDALKAGFPAGTVSGAPKVRAMEIIDELESVRRGIYAGCIGYISADGSMDTCIALRTAVIKDEKIHIQAGAGVVVDSKPELEHKECQNKAGALMAAAREAHRFA